MQKQLNLDKNILLKKGRTAKNYLKNLFSKSFQEFDTPYFTLASTNKTKDVMWATPRANVLNHDWVLLLNDLTNDSVHVLFIPKNTYKKELFKNPNKKVESIHLEFKNNNESIVEIFSKIDFTNRVLFSINY